MLRRFLALAVLLTAVAVRADYLYWMLDADAVNPDVTLNEEYAYGRVCVVSMNATSEVLGYLGGGQGDTLALGSQAIFSDFGSYGSSEYGFFVEVWNYGVLNTQPTEVDWYVAGVSGIVGYTTLVDALHVAQGSLSQHNVASAWAPTVAVPEPTSGLLALLGLALLAVRRRRV